MFSRICGMDFTIGLSSMSTKLERLHVGESTEETIGLTAIGVL